VTIEGKQHKAMADQIATVSKTRLRDRVSHLGAADMDAVEAAIKTQLGLR
jgi:mRNA-degrading endonuclease toxin of MazEF toxin-antitoxin module